jgi:hypothetical protein
LATIHVRDVPDEIAEIIAQKASAERTSVSAYLRRLMTADAEAELQRRAMRRWSDDLVELQREMGLPGSTGVSGADLVREAREEYEQGHA